jgi:hypothetical protein
MNKVSRCGPGSSHRPSLQLEVFADELLQTNLPGRPVGDMQSNRAAPEEFQLCAERDCATIISAVAKTVPICASCQLVGEQQAWHMRYLLASCLATKPSTSSWPHPFRAKCSTLSTSESHKPHALLVLPNLGQPSGGDHSSCFMTVWKTSMWHRWVYELSEYFQPEQKLQRCESSEPSWKGRIKR